MIKNVFRLAVVVAGVMLLVGSSVPVVSYPPFLRQAAKFGAKDCTFCHTQPEGGEGWNERGKWLKAEKEKRKAEKVDAGWLADYKGDAAPGASAPVPAASGASDAKLTAAEKEKAVELLKKSMDETLKSVEGLSDAQWTYKPAPDRWSVGEVSEHILFFDPFLLDLVARVMTTPVNPDWRQN
ncbi:MAG: DinB family protein [Acidobacteriota bacterium]